MKVAGVKTPDLKEIHYQINDFNAFAKPAWYADGVAILKELSRLGIESEVYKEKARILDFQRKKTTQKVKQLPEGNKMVYRIYFNSLR